jgi:hypothetical protein
LESNVIIWVISGDFQLEVILLYGLYHEGLEEEEEDEAYETLGLSMDVVVDFEESFLEITLLKNAFSLIDACVPSANALASNALFSKSIK